jgi:hypothetical protein
MASLIPLGPFQEVISLRDAMNQLLAESFVRLISAESFVRSASTAGAQRGGR